MRPRLARIRHAFAPIALREAVPLVGLAFVYANDELPHRPLAAVSLGVAMIMPFFGGRPRWMTAIASGIAVFVTLALVYYNGGIDSPLLPVWFALVVSWLLGDVILGVAVAASSLAAVTPALIGGGLEAVMVFATALVTFVICIAVTRRHTRTIDTLQSQVTTDSLTGVGNRLALDRRIAEFFGGEHPSGALVFVDLDQFREINRTRGHAEADTVLKAVGSALTRAFPHDFVGRPGGDEFVLLLDRKRDPLELARRAIRVIADAGPPGLQLTATAGVAYVPEDGLDPVEVRLAADLALRWGKADGKARALRYDPTRAASGPGVGESDIRRLWLEDRISIHVQPIVDLRLGRVSGYEALARFDLDGDNSPLRMFALANSFGLRAQLELACLKRSLRLLEQRPQGTYLSVNLSPDLLELSVVHNTLEAIPDLDGLVLELTEDAVIEDYDHLANLLARHVRRGLKIAVDDFGAGQANLRHAWSILPAYLKLDRTLVSRLDSDPARRALVGSIVDYAAGVGAALIAEGVETTAELDALLKLGVPHAQGFLLAPPVAPWPVIDVDQLLPDGFPLSSPSHDPELLIVHAGERADVVQQRFAQNPRATDAVLQDDEGHVVGLLTRNKLLVTLGARFGYDVHGERTALSIADTQFISVQPGTGRDEIIARAVARDDSRRYDPILLVDGNKRLLGKLTIREVLEPEIGAAALQTDQGSTWVSTHEPGEPHVVRPASVA